LISSITLSVGWLTFRRKGLLRLACAHDLEGIVAKQKYAPYLPEQETTWVKIRNRRYSQWTGGRSF
jgi:hypothetical protein